MYELSIKILQSADIAYFILKFILCNNILLLSLVGFFLNNCEL